MHKLASLLIVLFVGSSANAAVVLDQDNPMAGPGFALPDSGIQYQQQIVAGVAGRLEKVALYLGINEFGSADVFVNVGDGWQTDTNEFLTRVNSGPAYVELDVSSANIWLTQGQSFMLGINGVDGDNGVLVVRGNYPATYDSGSLYRNGLYVRYTHGDLGFRTWMAVPEPQTALFFSATVCLVNGAFRRHRRGAHHPE